MYRLYQQRYLDWCLVYIHVQAISTEIFGLVFGIYTCTGYINRDIWTGVWYIPVQAISTEIFGLVFGIYTCTGYINRDIWTGVWYIYLYRLNQQRYLDWCLVYIHVQAISTEIFGLVFGIYTCTG
jgi:hypothetical protein